MRKYYYYKKKVNKGKIIKDIFFIYLITVIIVLLFNSMIFQAYKIPSNSMEPSIKKNSRILVNKFSVGPMIPFTNKRLFDSTENIKRGDIVVFMSSEYYNKSNFIKGLSNFIYTISFSMIDFSNNKKSYESNIYIKRIVGVAGDRITFKLKGSKVEVLVNNIPEKEIIKGSYKIVAQNRDNSPLFESMILKSEFVLKEGEYFVLGDNRASSYDSRVWGCLKANQIIGKAFFKYSPVDNFGAIK